MKILILGASGLVGWNLFAESRLQGHEVIGTYRSHQTGVFIHLNMEDEDKVADLFLQFKPEATFYCAGWSHVDGCEDDPRRAYRENQSQPARAARLAHQAGSRFIYFSTSYIFDGVDGPYDETKAPCPVSTYGHSKQEGEEAVLDVTDGSALIARTMGVYGDEPQRKNFVFQVRRALASDEVFRVPNDQFGNVTYAPDLAKIILRLTEEGQTGIWNVAGPDPSILRSDFALKIADAYGLPTHLIHPVPTPELRQRAPRPRHGGLSIEKSTRFTSYHPTDWFKID